MGEIKNNVSELVLVSTFGAFDVATHSVHSTCNAHLDWFTQHGGKKRHSSCLAQTLSSAHD